MTTTYIGPYIECTPLIIQKEIEVYFNKHNLPTYAKFDPDTCEENSKQIKTINEYQRIDPYFDNIDESIEIPDNYKGAFYLHIAQNRNEEYRVLIPERKHGFKLDEYVINIIDLSYINIQDTIELFIHEYKDYIEFCKIVYPGSSYVVKYGALNID